ncbi:FAD-dependent monooxygenase [Paenibacillus wynnii]|uniref:FAD-dependent monooxygenase n=1 Tax=Paenibacillus wynnii TaxID=268407 RepID=UPI0023E3F7F9|nr:FAD-dependent monooxygenase [Paenibacillus wynnii]
MIAGGGIAGLAAAIALHRLGIPIRVLESYPELKPLGAGLILAPNALEAISRFSPNLTAQIIAEGYPANVYKIKNDRGSVLSEVKIGEGTSPSYSLSRPELYKLLMEQLPEGTVTFGCRAVRIHNSLPTEPVQLELDNGEMLVARAVIACDGIHSAIRSQLLPRIQPRYAGYTCWRAIIHAPELAETMPQTFTETWGANGRFGYVPLTRGRIYCYALFNAPYKDPASMTLTPAGLQRRFAAFHFPIPQLLEQLTADSLIHTDLMDTPALPRFAFDRVLLLGDAAHAMTPNLGQGACQALEDAAVLYEYMQRKGTLQSAFTAIEGARMQRSQRIAKASWRIGKIAQLENPFFCRIRDILMQHTPSVIAKRQMSWLYHMPKSSS